MLSHEDDQYFQSILARLPDAEALTFRAATMRGEPPTPAQCHANAEVYASENQNMAVVRGWLFDMSLSRLVAHSVVADGSGRLFEVTEKHPYRFIPHMGCEASFDAIRSKYPAIYAGRAG